MEWWLPLIWFFIIAVAIFMYVFLDGFDLGIGILFPFADSDSDRDIMMNSVAPVWDGNETWLVLGGGGLLVSFPIVYAVALSAFYIPVIAMLIALAFRGVAFEFRFKAERSRPLWDWGFFFGSLLASFFQGVILGAFIRGVAVEDTTFAGGVLDWLSPFSIFTGVAVAVGYTLLGATWLVLKTEGPLQVWAYRVARPLTVGLVAGIVIVSIWTPMLNQTIADRWFSSPTIFYLSPVPIITALLVLWLWRAESRRAEVQPFVLTLGLFLLSFAGFAISIWPNVLPPDVTLWDAAAAPSTQMFMLIGVIIFLPLVLGYTAYSYFVFRGKVGAGEGYH